MKTNRLTVIATCLLLVVFSSCKKQSTEPTGNGSSKLVKVENENGSSEISYNADGSIKNVVNKLPGGNVLATLAFTYNNSKVTEINYGNTKLKYTYTGDLVTKVERINYLSGTVMHKYEYAYTNTQLTETTEYWPNGNGGLNPFGKTSYSYGNGNVSKMELYDFINNGWVKTGEISIPNYDTKKNTSSNFENFIFLPGINFCNNNPLKEEHKNESGVIMQTITHAYIYDSSNRPMQRTTTTKTTGAPDAVEITKFYY